MKQNIFVIMIIATIVTATGVLPSLVTGSMNIVMAQGQYMTGVNSTTSMTGSITETESLPSAGQTGLKDNLRA